MIGLGRQGHVQRRRHRDAALLKRGVIGTYHHVSGQHLPAYLAEFDQRWNTRKLMDRERAVRAIQGAQGKRLTYKPLVRREQ